MNNKNHLKYIKCRSIIAHYCWIIFLVVFLMQISCNKKNDNVDSIVVQPEKNKIENIIKTNPLIINTWSTIFSPPKFCVSRIKDFDSTKNKGSIVLLNTFRKPGYGENYDKSNLIKLDSLGGIEWKREIPNKAYSITNINENNYFLITSDTLQLYDNNGNLQLEKKIKIDGYNFYNFNKVIYVDNSEMLLVGEVGVYNHLINEGIILKLNLNLEIIDQHLFDYNSGAYKIKSIVKSLSGDCYFTGKRNEHLFIGKLNNNFDVVWEKNNYFETGLGAKMGNTILETKDDNILVLSSQSTTYRNDNQTVLLKIDKEGEIISQKFFKGHVSEGFNSLIELQNSFFLLTFDSPLSSKLYKLSSEGDIINEITPTIQGKNVPLFSLIKSDDVFFANGTLPSNQRINNCFFTMINNKGETGGNILNYTTE